MTNTEFTPYTIEGLDEFACRNGWAKITQEECQIKYIKYVTPTGSVLRFYATGDTVIDVENVTYTE